MNKKGFTLLELMIVIAIVAAMAAIGVPNYLAWMPERRLDAGTQDVLQGILKARTRAIMTNRNTVISFDEAGNSFTAFLDDGSGGGTVGDNTQNGTEETIFNQGMPPGIDLKAPSFGNTLIFDNRGIPTTAVGTVELENANGNTETIELFLTGHGRIQ